MSSLSSVGRGYSITQPIEDQMKVTIAKAKLSAVEAANTAKLTALNQVVEELHLTDAQGVGTLLDIDV
ncbi:hypothetical protein [uncultured Maritalea sp.]|jgi:hypothetical protein|uniref:hypothetical protein n=1 Tax=uncultured Maritalea sp. TaxID=757249 RepID=UPI002602279B|nr:hypothetical protein [uncultured Maritalea sp.]